MMEFETNDADMDRLDNATRQLRDAVTPAMPEGLSHRAAGMMRAAARGQRRWRLGALSGLAATVAIASLAAAWFILHASADLAFADVVAQVRQTHSMTADLVQYVTTAKGIERQKQGIIYVKGSRTRDEFDGGDHLINISDDATGEMLNLNTAGRSAIRRQFALSPFNFGTWLYNVADVATTSLGEKQFNGKRLAGFSGVIERPLRDGTVERGGKFVVWVDPRTKLPERLMGLDADGREMAGLEDIRFGVALDDTLFDLTPPAGYAVRDQRGPTLAQLRPPATTQEAVHFTLKPGQGIGDVPLRATRERIVAAFGEPESVVKDEPRPGWSKLEYPSRGMTLTLGPEGGLRGVRAYNAVRGSMVAHNFPGKTNRGIGINSTGEQLEAAYGPPDTASPSRKAENRFVRYPRLGMTAALGTGTITSITVTPPGGMGIELPITDDARRRAEAMVLKPGVGIDDLKIGATREQAIAALGPPADPNAGDLQYPVVGLSLNFDKEGRLHEIWGTTPRELENDGNPFFGRTEKGIRIGATRADVEAAYGKADEVEEALAKVRENVAPSEVIEYLTYNPLGLMVELKGGTVTALVVQRKKPAPSTQPATR